jgi:hypothetical protein
VSSSRGSFFGSVRLRAFVSLLLGLAVGMGLLFPARHGCRSAVESQDGVAAVVAGVTTAVVAAGVRHEGHGGGHRAPSSPVSSECSCVGDACGVSLAAPRPASVIAAAPLALIAVAPVRLSAARPALAEAYVLPFANGPPAFLQA